MPTQKQIDEYNANQMLPYLKLKNLFEKNISDFHKEYCESCITKELKREDRVKLNTGVFVCRDCFKKLKDRKCEVWGVK